MDAQEIISLMEHFQSFPYILYHFIINIDRICPTKTLQKNHPQTSKTHGKTRSFQREKMGKIVESTPRATHGFSKKRQNGPNTSRLRCRLLLGGPHGDNSIDPKRPVALCFHGIGAVVDLLGWVGGV